MSFSKEIALGKIGKLVFSEANGIATLAVTASEAVNVGEVKDVATVNATVNVQVSAVELLNVIFALIESKSPAGVVLIEKEIQSVVIALLAKV